MSEEQGSAGAPTGRPAAPVVYVQAKSGGFTRAVIFMVALMIFGLVFFIGIGIGFAGSMATKAAGEMTIMERQYREGRGDRVAIIPVEGAIDARTALFVRTSTNRILDSGNIGAVVLRVDSPGGGVSASDQIWYQIKRLREADIPVVASYGGMAASGGYYVSCHADRIFAEETCITGSIGVIAQMMTVKNLMDKIGIEPITIMASDSPKKDVGNPFREWEPRDRETFLSILDSAHETFRDRVRDGRITEIGGEENLQRVTDGSIFTAAEAVGLGLVDEIGYLDDAIAHAEQLANLPIGRSPVTRFDKPTLFGEGLLFKGPSAASLDADQLRSLVNDLNTPRIMYRIP